MLSASDLSRVRAASDKPTPPPPLVAAGVSPCSSVTTTKKQSPPRNNLFALSTSAQLPLPVASDSVPSSNLLRLEPVLAAQKQLCNPERPSYLSAHTHYPIAPTASPARPSSLPKRLIPPDRCNAPDLPSYSPGNALAASTNPIVSAGPPLQLLRIYHRAFFWPL